MALAKSGGTLVDSDSLIKFLEPWYGLDKHCTEILACLDSTISSNSIDRKTALKAAQTSKKIKFIDDPAIAEAARITALRDQWLIQWGKANKDTKAQMQKAAQAEKK